MSGPHAGVGIAAARLPRAFAAALIVAAWVGASGPARGQPAPAAPAGPAGPAAPAAPTAPSSERERDARNRYEEGAAAFRTGHYQLAISCFSAADELAPSAALAFNIARVYERLADQPGALRFYRDYLRRETSPVNLEGIRARIAELESSLMAQGVQQLTVLSQPLGAFVSVDGQPRGPTPWTGELVPGKHQLTLLKEGYVVTKRELTLGAAHAAEINVPLDSLGPAKAPVAAPPPSAVPASHAAPAPPSAGTSARSSFGPWPWITLGAGGAALLAAGGFELARAGAEQDASSTKTQLVYADRFHAMQSHQTTARVFAGVGGALIVAGGVLLVIEFAPRSRAPVAATATCTEERCVGSLRGTF